MDYTKFLGEVGLAELWNLMTSFVEGRLFVGTRAEYEEKFAVGAIPVGCLVVLTDEADNEAPDSGAAATSATLGTALLGTMILGQK